MTTELAHITPAIKKRIEALGNVPGETPANPVAWLVAEVEEARRDRLQVGLRAGFDVGALEAEVERFQSGGCARDQRTTQYCAEVVQRDAEIASLRAIASDLLAPVTESWRAHAAKIETENAALRIKVAQQEQEIRAVVEAFERYGNLRSGKDLGASVEALHAALEKARATP